MNSSVLKQSGAIIIDILIGVVLGLIIIGGAIQVVVSSSNKARTHEAQSALIENIYFAHEDIKRAVMIAGSAFNTLDGAQSPFAAYSSKPYNKGATSSSITLVYDGPAATPGDSLAVRYKVRTTGDGFTCQGNNPDPGIYTLSYYSNGTNLMCTEINPAGNRTSTTIANGIEHMQVQYGLDTNADGIADYYTNATTIDGRAGSWPSVTAVRIAFLVSSGNFKLPRSAQLANRPAGFAGFELLDVSGVLSGDQAKDDKLYRVSQTTVLLRSTRES